MQDVYKTSSNAKIQTPEEKNVDFTKELPPYILYEFNGKKYQLNTQQVIQKALEMLNNIPSLTIGGYITDNAIKTFLPLEGTNERAEYAAGLVILLELYKIPYNSNNPLDPSNIKGLLKEMSNHQVEIKIKTEPVVVSPSIEATNKIIVNNNDPAIVSNKETRPKIETFIANPTKFLEIVLENFEKTLNLIDVKTDDRNPITINKEAFKNYIKEKFKVDLNINGDKLCITQDQLNKIKKELPNILNTNKLDDEKEKIALNCILAGINRDWSMLVFSVFIELINKDDNKFEEIFTNCSKEKVKNYFSELNILKGITIENGRIDWEKQPSEVKDKINKILTSLREQITYTPDAFSDEIKKIATKKLEEISYDELASLQNFLFECSFRYFVYQTASGEGVISGENIDFFKKVLNYVKQNIMLDIYSIIKNEGWSKLTDFIKKTTPDLLGKQYAEIGVSYLVIGDKKKISDEFYTLEEWLKQSAVPPHEFAKLNTGTELENGELVVKDMNKLKKFVLGLIQKGEDKPNELSETEKKLYDALITNQRAIYVGKVGAYVISFKLENKTNNKKEYEAEVTYQLYRVRYNPINKKFIVSELNNEVLNASFSTKVIKIDPSKEYNQDPVSGCNIIPENNKLKIKIPTQEGGTTIMDITDITTKLDQNGNGIVIGHTPIKQQEVIVSIGCGNPYRVNENNYWAYNNSTNLLTGQEIAVEENGHKTIVSLSVIMGMGVEGQKETTYLKIEIYSPIIEQLKNEVKQVLYEGEKPKVEIKIRVRNLLNPPEKTTQKTCIYTQPKKEKDGKLYMKILKNDDSKYSWENIEINLSEGAGSLPTKVDLKTNNKDIGHGLIRKLEDGRYELTDIEINSDNENLYKHQLTYNHDRTDVEIYKANIEIPALSDEVIIASVEPDQSSFFDPIMHMKIGSDDIKDIAMERIDKDNNIYQLSYRGKPFMKIQINQKNKKVEKIIEVDETVIKEMIMDSKK
jgi:hypothetical protein